MGILKRLSGLEVDTHIKNRGFFLIRLSPLKMLVSRNVVSISEILTQKFPLGVLFVSLFSELNILFLLSSM